MTGSNAAPHDTDQPAPTNRRSFRDRQRDAALQQIQEQQAEFSRVADIVLPKRRDPYHRSSDRVTEVIRLGNDYLVEVTDRDRVTWTTVVGGKRTSWHHDKQEGALLHLIARRYNDNDNSNHAAAFYAGRVLGITDKEQ